MNRWTGGCSVGQRVRSDGSSRSAEATLTPRDTMLHLLDSGSVYIYTETGEERGDTYFFCSFLFLSAGPPRVPMPKPSLGELSASGVPAENRQPGVRRGSIYLFFFFNHNYYCCCVMWGAATTVGFSNQRCETTAQEP